MASKTTTTTKTEDRASAGEERLSRAITALEGQLRGLARDLAILHRQLRGGDLAGLADAKRKTDEIRQWLGIALEMEMRLETRHRSARPDGGEREIDLDDARYQIGCRLDRLRRARCPGRFPR